MKDGNTTFKTVREKQLCDPNNLKEHFHAHFKICSKSVNPFELKDVKMPSFIRQVQGIYTSEANQIPLLQTQKNSDQQSNH